MRGVSRRAWPLVALLVLVLGACSGLPTSSDVQPGLNVTAKVDQRVRADVDAPIKGGSKEVIARDFIRAGALFQETDENKQVVGRAYLFPSSVDRWKPTSSVTIYDAPTGLTTENLPADEIRLTVDAVATIDSTGHYAELAPGTTRSVTLSMRKNDEGEWRVDLPPSGFGLWINTDDVDRVFSPYDLNYVVPGTSQLVQDVTWLPSGDGVATALSRAQLGSVPDYLDGAAETAIPSGTKLAVDAVEVDSGTATVTLSNSAQVIEPQRRRAMWAQFVATLLQLPVVTAVRLEVQGSGPIAVPGLPDEVGDLSSLGFALPGPVGSTVGAVRRGSEVEQLDPQDVGDGSQLPAGQPLPGTTAAVTVVPQYTGLALSADGSDLAAVARGREELVRWRAGKAVTLPAPGVQLTDPAYDDHQRLWVSGLANRTQQVWTFPTTDSAPGTATAVSASWLTNRRVSSLRVSPDGTRVAVVSTAVKGGDARLDIAGIRRASDGVPVSLASPYRQGEPLVGLTAVTWVGPLELAVLAQEKTGAPRRPFEVDLGGGVGLRRTAGGVAADQRLIPAVPGAVALTVRAGSRGLIALTGSSALVLVGGTWTAVPGVTDLVVGGF